MSEKPTDWDAYYKKPAKATSITRRISAAKIQKVLKEPLSHQNVSVCELGGANSCFAEGFLKNARLQKYHVIDSNAYGIDLFLQRFSSDKRVTAEQRDALLLAEGYADYEVVYSVGLIEHFDKEGTQKCIEGHFHSCRPKGTILMTFPTPTLPYRIIRKSAELMGIWAFPDERPLTFDEVNTAIERCGGKITHQSINWWIGLTQGYVVIEK